MDGLSAVSNLPRYSTIGRCPNEFYCELASENKAIAIEDGARFVCPECGKPLNPVKAGAPPPQRPVSPLLIPGLALLAVAIAGYAVVSRQPSPAPHIHPAQTGRDLARIEPLPALLLPPATPQTTWISLEAPPPVNIGASQPRETPARRAARPAARKPPGAKHPPGLLKDQPQQHAKFVITGGEPPYPDSATETSGSNVVHVTCMIAADGTPSDCEATGAAPFRRAVMNWLTTGHVRIAPALHQGTPVAGRQSWTIYFEDSSE